MLGRYGTLGAPVEAPANILDILNKLNSGQLSEIHSDAMRAQLWLEDNGYDDYLDYFRQNAPAPADPQAGTNPVSPNAGGGGGGGTAPEEKGMPGWFLPVVIGGSALAAVLGFMASRKK